MKTLSSKLDVEIWSIFDRNGKSTVKSGVFEPDVKNEVIQSIPIQSILD